MNETILQKTHIVAREADKKEAENQITKEQAADFGFVQMVTHS